MTDNLPTIYKGKPLSEFTDWELEQCNYEFAQAEAERENASKHHKFDKINNKKAMDFPPPNPQYLKLKEAINLEFEKRKTNA